MNWDNLRFLLAVAKQGSISGAAKQLRVNHVTVSRRIDQLEADLGSRLFDRTPKGYILTEAGQRVYRFTQSMADIADEITLSVKSIDAELAGPIRFSFPNIDLSKELTKFLVLYPNIEIQADPTSELRYLSQLEADVVLRFTNDPPDTLVGRELLSHSFSPYAHADYLSSLPASVRSPNDCDWLLYYDANNSSKGMEALLKEHAPDARVVLRSRSPRQLSQACISGLGVNVMPDIVASELSSLVKLPFAPFTHEYGLWLLCRKELKNTARIKVFIEYMVRAIRDRFAPAG